MATARVIEVADAGVAVIRASWQPVFPDEVLRVWDPDIEADTLTGRKVYFFAGSYLTKSLATRRENYRDNRISILIVERYTGQPADRDAWVDDLVLWVETVIFAPLEDPRKPAILAGVWPDSSEVEVVVDIEELRERKLFFSVVTITFEELKVS